MNSRSSSSRDSRAAVAASTDDDEVVALGSLVHNFLLVLPSTLLEVFGVDEGAEVGELVRVRSSACNTLPTVANTSAADRLGRSGRVTMATSGSLSAASCDSQSSPSDSSVPAFDKLSCKLQCTKLLIIVLHICSTKNVVKTEQ